MTLLPEETKTFFRNWLELIAFVNDKHKLVKNFGHPKSPFGINLESINKIDTVLWKNVGIIDEYINSVRDLPKDDIQLLKEWKNKKVEGPFIILRHMKNYSVFLDGNNDLLYGVIGISSPISEMIPDYMLPVAVKTTLIPFGDRIIYDSVFSVSNVQIGPIMRMDYKGRYIEIKKKKGIITTL
jgi:hypothetical protein